MRLRHLLHSVHLPDTGKAPTLVNFGSSNGELSGAARSPLVFQYSSQGSVSEHWLSEEFGKSLSQHAQARSTPHMTSFFKQTGPQPSRPSVCSEDAVVPPIQIIWPSSEVVRNSVEGWAGGGSLPCPAKNINSALSRRYHKWSCDDIGRQHSVPHMKTFLRYNRDLVDDHGQPTIAWCYVGSHNLSKAAWGALQKSSTQLMIRSFEMGVLLLPSRPDSFLRVMNWSDSSQIPALGNVHNHWFSQLTIAAQMCFHCHTAYLLHGTTSLTLLGTASLFLTQQMPSARA